MRLDDPELKRTVRLAAPVVVTQLGLMAMGIVDAVMVGPLGSAALAATSVGNGVFFTAAVFCMGVVMALDPMIAQAAGAGRYDRVGALVWQGIWVGLLMGVPLTLLFRESREVFVLLEQPPEVAQLASDYLGWRCFGATPFLVFVAFRALLNGMEDTLPIMYMTLVANLINAAVDWLFIYGKFGLPAMGVGGAGLATSVVRFGLLVAVVFYVLRARGLRRCRLGFAGPERATIWRLTRLGTPIGAQLAIELAVFGVTAILAGWLGTQPQAAHQIAISLASLTFMVPLGLSTAASVRVGRHIGAGVWAAAMHAGKVALGLGAFTMGGAALCFLVIPEPLASIFSPEPEVLVLAGQLLMIAAAFQIFDGVQVVGQGCLRGAGDTRTALYTNLAAHWLVGIPFGYLLAFEFGLGVHGLWWGLTLSLGLVALTLTTMFLRGGWKKLARLVE